MHQYSTKLMTWSSSERVGNCSFNAVGNFKAELSIMIAISKWSSNGRSFSSQGDVRVFQQFQRGKRFLHPTRRTEIIAYSWSSTLPSFIVLQNFDGNPFNDLIAHKDPQQKTLWIPALFHRRKVTRSQVS